MDDTHDSERALAVYVNAAADLAEAVKKDLQKRGYISEETILALNDFIIAANDVADLTKLLEDIDTTIN